MTSKTLLVCLLALGACSAQAQQVLKVATYEGAKPIHAAVSAVYQEVGLKAEFVNYPLERALKSVESGEADADIARVHGATAAYQNMVELSESLSEVQLLAVVKKGFKASKLTVPELKGYKVGLVRGTKAPEGLVAKLGLEATSTNDAKQLFQMLSNDRFEVGLIVSSISVPPEFAATLVTLQPPLSTLKVVHVLNKKWAALGPKIDAAIKAMKADGRWAKLTAPQQ